MDSSRYTCFKLLSFALPLFCLLSWTCAASSSSVVRPSASSALLAADTLRSRGYSLFASVVVSLTIVSANFSGTILAPPDFAFSSTAAMFLNNRRPPPRPSIALLLYHTLKPPLVLTWPALSARDDGEELRTLYNNNCVYLFRSPYSGEVTISSSPLIKNPLDTVQIRQPDLYVDDYLTVHGIDGVLDPSYATKCDAAPHVYPTAENAPRRVNRTFLDHAMRRMRRRGYNVVAAAMGVRKSEMLSLTSVTVLAVSDKHLFLKSGGFRYDFRHHVVPTRRRISDIGNETRLVTLAPNKTVFVHSAGSAITIDGVPVSAKEVYHNRWIVVLSIMKSLDDFLHITDRVPGDSANTPPPSAGDFAIGNLPKVSPSAPPFLGEPESTMPSIAPANFQTNSTDLNSFGAPSPADKAQNSGDYIGSPPPETVATQESPALSPLSDDHCAISSGIEGGDLLCSPSTARRLQETTDLNVGHVEESQASNAKKVLFVDTVNIADDLFFYT